MRLLRLTASLLLSLGSAPGAWGAVAAQPAAAPDSVLAAPDTSAAAPVPQVDALDLLNRYLLGRRVEPEIEVTTKTGLAWAILPSISYNPVYGAAFGLSATGAGKRGEKVARYSSISISGNVSTTGQIQAQVRGDVFSPSGNYMSKGDFRYLDTERSTWGLGPMTTDEDREEYPMEFKLYRAYLTYYRRVSGPVFLGLGYHYDGFAEIVDQRAAQGEATPFTDYSGGAVSRTDASGLSLNLLGDTRDNLVNPASGYYLSMSLRNYWRSLGSDANWQEMWAEMRVYPHLPRGSANVLAFWMYTWFTFGPAPYLDLPSNGWDTYGRGARGYLAGRVRGPAQGYLEAEYRLRLSRNGLWGAVVFVNLTSTSNPETQIFGPADPGAGVGLRMKFNKRSNANLAIDYGWGRYGSGGAFFGLSEVF
jgi:hypothetical protein